MCRQASVRNVVMDAVLGRAAARWRITGRCGWLDRLHQLAVRWHAGCNRALASWRQLDRGDDLLCREQTRALACRPAVDRRESVEIARRIEDGRVAIGRVRCRPDRRLGRFCPCVHRRGLGLSALRHDRERALLRHRSSASASRPVTAGARVLRRAPGHEKSTLTVFHLR